MKKIVSIFMAITLCFLTGCTASDNQGLTSVVENPYLKASPLNIYLDTGTPAGMADVFEIYKESSRSKVNECEDVNGATLVYVKNMASFENLGGENTFYSIDELDSTTLNALVSQGKEYTVINKNDKNYGISTGIEGFGYMVDARMLGEVFGLEIPDDLITNISKSSYDEWRKLIKFLAKYINNPSNETITLNGVDYESVSIKPQIMADVEAVFSMPLGLEQGYVGKSFNPVLNYSNVSDDNFKSALISYCEAMDMATATTTGTNGEVARGIYFDDETDAMTAFNNFANGKCIMIAQEGSMANEVKSMNKGLAGRLAFLPIKLNSEEFTQINNSIMIKSQGFWAINKSASEDDLSQALDFLTWYYLSAEGQSLITSKLGLMSFNLLKPDTSIMGSTLNYINDENILIDYSENAPANGMAKAGEYLKEKMNTAVWNDNVYEDFANVVMENWV